MAQLLVSVTASTVIIPHANALTLTHDWLKEKASEEWHIQIPVTLAYTFTAIVTILSLTIVAIVIKQCSTHIINFYTHYYNRNAVYTDILLELTTHMNYYIACNNDTCSLFSSRSKKRISIYISFNSQLLHCLFKS